MKLLLETRVANFCRDAKGDAHAAVEALLDRFASAPEKEPSLKHVQPFIERIFGSGHPVTQIRDDLERAESSGDTRGERGRGRSPFSSVWV